MPLASEELETEFHQLVKRQLPTLDPPVTHYLAHLFATARVPPWEDIKVHWVGTTHIEVPEQPDERTSALRLKLGHSRRMGDGCLVLSTFYREETSRTQPPIDLVVRVGEAGYKTAGFYAAIVGEGKEIVYPVLADEFPQIVVRLGPSLFEHYLRDRNPPRRVVLHTPYGERFFRVRYSMS